MRRRVRRHLSFANVCALLALVIAVGTGGAYAADTVGSSDIIDSSIQTVDLHDEIVTTQKLAPAAVTTGELAGDAVGSPQVGDGSLTGTDLADGGVANVDLAANAVDSSKVADSSLTGADIAPGSIAGGSVAAHSITQGNISGTDKAGEISVARLAKGRCATISVSAGGAQPGDAGILTTNRSIPKGEVLYLQGVLTGRVQIKACNLSGKRLPALSHLPVRILTFH